MRWSLFTPLHFLSRDLFILHSTGNQEDVRRFIAGMTERKRGRLPTSLLLLATDALYESK